MSTEPCSVFKKQPACIVELLIGLLFAGLYLIFPTRMHFGDGLYYAFHLERMPVSQGFHPHHLLWLPIMHGIYTAIHLIFPSVRGMAFLQGINAVCGGISVYLLIRIVTSITKNNIAGVIAGLGLGLSWGMLHYAADANIYVPILTLMLLNFSLIISGDELSLKKAVLATLIMALISFLHQIGFFFAFVILAAIIMRSPKEIRIKTALTCIALYCAINLLVYYSVFLSIRNTLIEPLQAGLLTWITAYGHNREFWSPFALGFLGAQKAFDRAQFNLFFHITDLNKAFYYGGYKESAGTLIAYALVQLIVIVIILYELKRLFLRNAQYALTNRTYHVMIVLWFMLFYIFNQFFCAFDVGYKLLYLAPLIMTWSLMGSESSSKIKGILKIALPIILIGMSFWNFSKGVIPDTKPENNPYFKDALRIIPYVGRNDIVLYTEKERYTAAVMRCYSDADSVFARENPRLIQSEIEDFDNINESTINFLRERYKRIIFSDALYDSRLERLYLPENHIPPPHPQVLICEKSRILSLNNEIGCDRKVWRSSEIIQMREVIGEKGE